MSILAKMFPLWFDDQYRMAHARVYGSRWSHSEAGREVAHVTKLSQALVGANQAGAAASQARAEIQLMREEMDRLQLVVGALTELLEVRLGVSQEELQLMIERIDLADGRPDGRASNEVHHDAIRCASCEKPLNPERDECIYCATPFDLEERAEERAALVARAQQAAAEAEAARRAAAEEARRRRAAAFVAICIECSKPIPDDDVSFTVRGVTHSACAPD